MSKSDCELITELKAELMSQQYSPMVVGNYCAYARGFLDHLAGENIVVTDVTEAQVERYLRDSVALFRQRRGRRPGPRWHQIPCAGIHALLRLVQGQWPPAPKATCAADALRFTICNEYETWLHEERGFARPSIDAFLWEARNFLGWQLERCGVEGPIDLSLGDIDRYMDLRAEADALLAEIWYRERLGTTHDRCQGNLHPYARRTIASSESYTAWSGGGFAMPASTSRQMWTTHLPSCACGRDVARIRSAEGHRRFVGASPRRRRPISSLPPRISGPSRSMCRARRCWHDRSLARSRSRDHWPLSRAP